MGKNGVNQKGTITKVITDNLSEEELEELWKKHNKTLQELEKPTENYTRYTSDLIISLRDTVEKLILAGAIPEAPTKKDTATYVWKKLQERNIPYAKNNFYRYFNETQKRDWQGKNEDEGTKQTHKHDFQSIGQIKGMGEVARCGAPCIPACQAMMINGRLFEQQDLEEKEPELKKPKPKSNFEEQNEDFITSFKDVVSRLKAVNNVMKITDMNLNDEEKKELKGDLLSMRKAGEFLDMAFDRKNLIAPFTQHRLAMSYAKGTQNYASGIYLMYRIDLAQRNHGEAVKDFKDKAQFAKLLSSKQTTKAMRGRIRNLNPRYEPQNELQAKDAGFSGQQCINCKGFRVDDDKILNVNWKKGKLGWKEGDDPKDKPDPIHEKFDTKLVCFHCGKVQKRIHFTLPKQEPKVTTDFDSSEMSTEDFEKWKKEEGHIDTVSGIKFPKKTVLNS